MNAEANTKSDGFARPHPPTPEFPMESSVEYRLVALLCRQFMRWDDMSLNLPEEGDDDFCLS